MEDFDAILRDWVIIETHHGASGPPWIFLIGTVQGDRKGRFADGRTIRTSLVTTPRRDIAAGWVIQTRNTRYLLAGTAH